MPQPVIDYFGFRDGMGTFNLSDLSPGVRRLMYKRRKTDVYSLYEIGLEYRKRGKHIAADVIREMPASLLAVDDAGCQANNNPDNLENIAK